MKWKSLIGFFLGAALWLSVSDLVSFSGKIYEWVDEAGNVGFTDDLRNIPEKYRKTATLESEVPAPRQGGESPEMQELPPPSNTPDTDDAGHDRAYWQGRIKDLREQRADLIEKKLEIEQKIEALSRYSEADRTYIELRRQYLDELAKTKDDVKDIGHQLEIVLPEEARKLNAPPGWLR